MTTVLQYLVVAAVIGLVVFGIAVFVFGRGEQLAPLSPRVSPTELPDSEMTADDVRKVRFAMALRGYRMSDVDWALERMAGELDRLRALVTGLSGADDLSGSHDLSGADGLSDASGQAGSETRAEQRARSSQVLTGLAATPNSGPAAAETNSAETNSVETSSVETSSVETSSVENSSGEQP